MKLIQLHCFIAVIFQLSMMSTMLDSSLCSTACATGQSTLAQIPRVAFDWTGIYVDPATSAALTGLAYMLYSSGKSRNSKKVL